MRVAILMTVLLVVVGLGVVWFWLGTSKHQAVALVPGQVAVTPTDTTTVIAGLAPLPALITNALAADTPVIAWVAHAGARLEPCGCVSGMHGGLVRRASLLTRLMLGPHLVVEGGGWSSGTADYQLLRTRTYLNALPTSGCSAIGLGAAEVRLGGEVLRALIGQRTHDPLEIRPPVVSANVRFTDSGTPLATVLRITIAGRPMAITSVAPAAAHGAGLTVEDPAQALLQVLPTLNGAQLIVIADLDAEALSELAKGVPGISLLIGGDVEQPSPRPLAIGACRVIYAANEGKTLGYWPWGGDECTFELISDQVPDHPLVRAAIRAYQDQLGAMNLAIDDRTTTLTQLGSDHETAHFLGAQACASCHAEEAKIYAQSGHTHSFAALERKGYQHDPDCLRCHVTGLGLPDGYHRSPSAQDAEQSQHTAQVSCESCHGRGSIHVSERSAGQPSSGSLTPVTPATCLVCHDPENSPHFEFTSYWQRIHHGTRSR